MTWVSFEKSFVRISASVDFVSPSENFDSVQLEVGETVLSFPPLKLSNILKISFF